MVELASRATGPVVARRLILRGRVQGVGFRPFVYRVAIEHGITGHVRNQLGQVEIIAAGFPEAVARFVRAVIDEAPPLAAPVLAANDDVERPATASFSIISSEPGADAQVFVPPDYFMCDDCRREMQDSSDRRYRYPFINCTQCGPRYTLIEALPYDRPNTSMAGFPLCPECEAEYLHPADRRFHAEPVACPVCGPQLRFERSDGVQVEDTAGALEHAVAAIRNGHIVAVKGVGGYHLVCDAMNESSVLMLRERKQRPHKPLAVMFPLAGDDGLSIARQFVDFDPAEAQLAIGPMRPIVLVRRRDDCRLAPTIAPGLGEIGVFLPYSPLHQLLLDGVGGPVVATSGNISGEPVLIDNREASRRLASVADAFLQHNRPIVRPADDPVFRRIGGAVRPLRIGRGCAPTELRLPWRQREPLLAVGGHMKGTVALSFDDRVVVSPHIGEMDSPRSLDVFERVSQDLQTLYGIAARRIACDAHPGYTTRRWAERQHLPLETVWHHEAHASAVAAEFDVDGEWLVFAWDGVGLGRDGTLWGGEAFVGRPGAWQRFASLRPFRLPGGDKAGREPWRSAAALYWECERPWSSTEDPAGLARAAWERDVNCPSTSAAGRLFDAAAAVICECPHASFEAQGPMMLEALCTKRARAIRLPLLDGDVLRTDWQPLVEMIADGRIAPARRAEIFHASMAAALVAQAHAARERFDIAQVGLSGGVFQNRVLAGQVLELLEADGFDVFLPLALPCNDAALSYGQAAEVAARQYDG